MRLKLLAGALLALALVAHAAASPSETKPIPKIEAKQATVHIPEAELLDVGIRVFDPGIPKNLEGDEEALAKKRIYPDLRKAEARYIPTLLRETLEETAQWGAVRVIPNNADFVDVIVTGKVIDSNGGFLAIDISAVDAAGRVWIKDKRYQSLVDLGAYKTNAVDEGARSVPERLLAKSPTTSWSRATSSPRWTARTSAASPASSSPRISRRMRWRA